MSTIDTQMMFENLRDSVESLLETYEAGRFRVVTEQKQSTAAEEHKGTLRTIQIFNESGNYPDGTSSKQESTHECTFQLEYIVAEPVKVDLNVLDEPNLTPAEYAAALANKQGAALRANRSMDALRRMVFQIILNPVNIDKDLGLRPTQTGPHVVTQIRLVNYRKNSLIAKGKIFEVTASEQLTCQVQETTAGATPIAVKEPGIEINNEFNTKTDAEDANPATAEIDINTA